MYQAYTGLRRLCTRPTQAYVGYVPGLHRPQAHIDHNVLGPQDDRWAELPEIFHEPPLWGMLVDLSHFTRHFVPVRTPHGWQGGWTSQDMPWTTKIKDVDGPQPSHQAFCPCQTPTWLTRGWTAWYMPWTTMVGDLGGPQLSQQTICHWWGILVNLGCLSWHFFYMATTTV